MNVRPQRTAIRSRLRPSTGGYDYHRTLKLRARRFPVDGEPIKDVIASCSAIIKEAECHSARTSLQNLADWKTDMPGGTIAFKPRLFESPGGMFKVHFTPDFGLGVTGIRTAIHIYNTRLPLVPRMTYAALSLFPSLYERGRGLPDDLAVLSLREPRLFRLSEAPELGALADRLVAALDETIREIGHDLGLPRSPAEVPRPHSP